MRLYERFGESGYHTGIATTFGIDFDAYEGIVLPRLRGSGCHNNILLADGAMLTQALDGASALPRHAGRLYTVSGVTIGGAFHPKLFLQLGRNGGRMIVGSANMTPSGLAGNVELVGELSCEHTDGGEQQLVTQAWRYVVRLAAGSGQALAAQIAWTEARTPWLRRATPAEGAVTLADGTQAALLTTGGAIGIAAQYVALIDDAPVRRLIVVSPYWDDKLEALRFLARRLSPAHRAVLIDRDALSFPKGALSRLKGLELFDRGGFRKGRFLHAKVSDRVLELCYTNDELVDFAADLGRDHPPFRWQPDRRVLLQAEINAAVLHLYGLSKVQAEWLLDSFTVLHKYEERDHNEFRTKRIVLEIYDEMAAAKQAGRAYQTRLNPVPADPSCCHPAKAAPIRLPAPALADGAWARPPQPQPGDTGAALAAILKTMDGPRPIRDVRLIAALVLEPRLIVPLLPQEKASEWRRLVGSEAQPLAGNVAAFATRVNAAWGSAVQNHRGNGRLIENLQSGTWAPGAGLETIETGGWPDGRAGFVLDALRSIDLGTAVNSLPDDIQRWIADAAAA